MSADPLAPVWPRLDSEPAVFFADRPEPAFTAARDRLVGLGVVRPADPARVAQCVACGGGSIKRVEWIEDRTSGTRRAFIACPTCGPVPVDQDHLRRWAIDVPKLMTSVAAAVGGRGTVQEVVRGRLWFLGRIPSLGRRHSAYFARTVQRHERQAVLAALAPHPRAVLFFPTEHAVRSWETMTPNPTLALESIVTLRPDGLAVDAAAIDGRLVDAGFGTPKARVPRKRADRAANIEILVKELREWMNGARENAYATADLRGSPELLPRPTQKDLAKSTGLTEAAVSRCLNDNQAIVLKLLWGMTTDLRSVLAWDGSVGGDSS